MSGHSVCVRNQPIVPAEAESPTLWWLAAAGALGAVALVLVGRAWGQAR